MIEPGHVLAVAAAFGAMALMVKLASGSAQLARHFEDRRDFMWRTAAERLRIEARGRSMKGRYRGLEISASEKQEEYGTTVSLRMTGRAVNDLKMTVQARGLSLVTGGDAFTGDRDFDKRVMVSAERPDTALAALNADVRRLAIEKTAVDIRLSRNDCSWQGAILEAVQIHQIADGMADLVTRLSVRDVPALLARNAATDPVAEVRLENLKALQRSHPKSPQALETSRDRLKDEDPRVRVQAASFLGNEGVAPLLELAGAVPTSVLPSVIEALAKAGEAGLEGRCAAWLREKDDDVQIAAAKAMGEIGTVNAVENLMKCVEDSTLLEGPVKKACREAIARIQSRLGNVTRGTLSLSRPAPQEGSLSLRKAGGELSVKEGEPSSRPPEEGTTHA